MNSTLESPGTLGLIGLASEHRAGRNNLLQLIQLRWVAVAGQLATIAMVQFALGIELPLAEMLALLAALTLFNLLCWLRYHAPWGVGDAELFAGLAVDIAVLSGQLFYSGGVTNPFILIYLLLVAVGAMLLRRPYIWIMVGFTALAFLALTQWYRPLALLGPALSTHYIGGLLLCFALNAALLVIFIHRIGRNLRQRDARLADLRQRAAEEEHIVRMGLLASGAAHELGTPLATLAVILGDWSRMAPFAGDPELREEIEEMQFQLARCKSIVSGILLAAGDARGEAPVVTGLHAFLDELVGQWQDSRPVQALDYRREGLPDPRIIADSALRQMIGNILDNALEAAPQGRITLSASCEGGPTTQDSTAEDKDGAGDVSEAQLVLRVQDQGPGFLPEMLERFGKPYQSSKGRPGGGLGLFLSVNVARMLGGRVLARNPAQGGAEVEVRLPLATLMPREPRDNAALHDE